jgi:predicted nucleic acid-binding Zn ribbon protein
MDFGSLLFVIGLLLVVGVYLALPFIERQAVVTSLAEREMSALQAQQDRILSRLADLEMDMEQDKLLESHYLAQRRDLLIAGADILRQIDALSEAAPELSSPSMDDEIEAAVARLRGSKGTSDRFCPSCGAAIVPGDQFCAKCGAGLGEGDAQ